MVVVVITVYSFTAWVGKRDAVGVASGLLKLFARPKMTPRFIFTLAQGVLILIIHYLYSLTTVLSTLRDPLSEGEPFWALPEREGHFWARNRLE